MIRKSLLLMVGVVLIQLLLSGHALAYRHPNLARFMSPDPQEYVDGNNRFEMLRSNPVNRLDPHGFMSLGFWGHP